MDTSGLRPSALGRQVIPNARFGRIFCRPDRCRRAAVEPKSDVPRTILREEIRPFCASLERVSDQRYCAIRRHRIDSCAHGLSPLFEEERDMQKRRNLETGSLSRFWPSSRNRHLVADPTVGRMARNMPAAQGLDPGRFRRRGLVDHRVHTLAGMLD